MLETTSATRPSVPSPKGMAATEYGKHLGHARFDTNSAPPTNAECKDPCHRTKDFTGRAPNRLRNLDRLETHAGTSGSEQLEGKPLTSSPFEWSPCYPLFSTLKPFPARPAPINLVLTPA